MEDQIAENKNLYLYLAWLTIASSAFVFMEPAPVDVLIPLLLIGGLLFGSLKLTKLIARPLLFVWLFILINVLSMFFAEDGSRSLWYILVTAYLAISMVFYILLIDTYKERGLNVLVSAYTFAATFSAAVGILIYFSIIKFNSLLFNGQRINAFFKDPNVFGPFLLFTVIVSMSKIETSKKLLRILWISIFALTILGTLLSFSRAAWGGLVVAITAYFGLRVLSVQSISGRYRRVVYIIMIIIVASIGIYYVINTPQVSRLFFERLQYQAYDVQRFETQRIAVSDAFKYPLGIGPGQAETFFSYAIHNSYFRVLIENGLIAFVVFCVFLIITLLRALKLVFRGESKYRWIYPVIAATLMGLFLNSYFVDTLHWRHFWLILALPWAFSFEKERPKEQVS
jgi:hypothetical protein